MKKGTRRQLVNEIDKWFAEHEEKSVACGMLLSGGGEYKVCIFGRKQSFYDSVFSWLVQDDKARREMNKVMRDVRRHLMNEETVHE